ncbi:S-adenosyl-L-methionine-dependent methyltransferase [Auricularia subglabra TFB-10046 SS5]|nr:S-adenosyl-L-methionine-dependent methyltransferase [Auricularia subglabra TFB-10046 SS5]
MVNLTSPAPATGSRFFDDPVNSLYILPADTEEGRRLNEQHEVIKHSAGGKLVAVPVQLGDGDKVMDSATGTGVWLLELASRSPAGASFYGIDISTHLFPAPSSTPTNVAFSKHSVFALPESFTSSFTLVNQRLVSVAFRTEEWAQALREYYRVVRPGGWVQLCEIHPPGFTPQGPHTARMLGIHGAIMKMRGMDNDCALHIGDWARAAGFINVQTMCTHAPVGVHAGDGPHNYTKSALSFFLAMKEVVVKNSIVATEEEYEQGVKDMEAEWNDTLGAYYPYYWIWAQKPVEQSV